MPGPPKPRKAKRQCHFDPNWHQQYPGILKVSSKLSWIYSFWNEVGKMKTLVGEVRFPSLVKLMVGLLLILPQKPTLKGDFPCWERFILISVQL